MAANARFWLGDSLYNQNEFELAILEYQKVIADFPSSPKAPAALLKQGLSFEKLNEKATAGIVYNKLLNEYSGSEQATTARQRLDSLR
jgi:tol-pal system protein YbgF